MVAGGARARIRPVGGNLCVWLDTASGTEQTRVFADRYPGLRPRPSDRSSKQTQWASFVVILARPRFIFIKRKEGSVNAIRLAQVRTLVPGRSSR